MPEQTFVGQSGHVVPATPGFHTVYHAETGQALTVWPVDAAELVRQGTYQRTPPVLAASAEVPTPRVPAAIREAIANEAAVDGMQADQKKPKR